MPTTDELQSQINALQSQLNSILGMADDDYIHQYSGEEIDAGITAAGKAVRYDQAQSLTTAQQAQARGNIAAMQGINSADHPGCYYLLNGSNVEWINPPLAAGLEYRTTERYLGKPVYVKAVNFGAGPNASTKTVAHGVTSIDKAIRVWGNIDNYNLIGFSGVSSVFVGTSEIAIQTSENLSARSIVVCMAYTKTTD